MVKAQRDLIAGERSATGHPPLLDIAAFLWQQAAEKALKVFLTWHDQPSRKTHDLVELLRQCRHIDAAFDHLEAAAITLTPYATQFRYPGAVLGPTASDAHNAELLAQETIAFVLARLPVSVACGF